MSFQELSVEFFTQSDRDVDVPGHKMPPRIGEMVIDNKGKEYRVTDVIWYSEWAGQHLYPHCSVILGPAKKKVKK